MKRHIILSAAMALLTMAYSLPSLACQTMCMRTRALHNGNLGGLAGADAKCNAEYPGFKAARSPDIVLNVSGANEGTDLAKGSTTLLKDTWDVGYVGNNCTNWTNGSNGALGASSIACFDYQTWSDHDFDPGTPDTAMTFNTCGATGQTGFKATSIACNNTKSILCCNVKVPPI